MYIASLLRNNIIFGLLIIFIGSLIGVTIPFITTTPNILLYLAVVVGFVPIVFLYRKFREGFIFTLTILICLLPNLRAFGFNVSVVNISVTDIMLFITFFYLMITLKIKRINLLIKQYPKFFIALCFIFSIIMIYLFFSVFFNNIPYAIKLVRTLLYVPLFYLLTLACFKKNNILKYIIAISIIVAASTIYSFIVENADGSYKLFRNSEAFFVSAISFLYFWVILNKSRLLTKIIIYSTIILLWVGVAVQQDRVQLIALFGSSVVAFLMCLFKKKIFSFTFLKSLFFINIFSFVLITILVKNNVGNVNEMITKYYENRIEPLFTSSGFNLDVSLDIRQLQYETITKIVKSDPISFFFGKGLAAEYWDNVIVVDSFWYWILLNFGVLGILMFAYIYWMPCKALLKNMNHNMSIPLLAALLAALITSLSIPSIIANVSDAVNLGLLLGFIHIYLKNNLDGKIKNPK